MKKDIHKPQENISEDSKASQNHGNDVPPIKNDISLLLEWRKWKEHFTKVLKSTIVQNVIYTILAGFLSFSIITIIILWVWGRNLPDYSVLKNYTPPVASRIYAQDGKLISQYAKERRIFIPINSIPKKLQQAFIATEDKDFYNHLGIDGIALIRAVFTNLLHAFQGKRFIGASTITQQVTRNFLLSNERTITRKIKEAILALRIEHSLSKDTILELYLNQIYLGRGNYGVAAASMYYFNKAPTDLELHEMAYLAVLPKAPNNYHPVRNRDKALQRRNWVLFRMFAEGIITEQEYKTARNSEFVTTLSTPETLKLDATYFLQETKQQISKRFGSQALYNDGLIIHTTLKSQYQLYAEKALQTTLLRYSMRHGYFGPIANLEKYDDTEEQFKKMPVITGSKDWIQGLVLFLTNDLKSAAVKLKNDDIIILPFSAVAWANPYKEKKPGKKPKNMKDVLQAGDVILLAEEKSEKYTTLTLITTPEINLSTDTKTLNKKAVPFKKRDLQFSQMQETSDIPNDKKIQNLITDNTIVVNAPVNYELRQVPKINGAIMVMDPHTGRVLAMVGGWDFEKSKFNRAVQAKRQPGSAVKPFVYLTALINGITPAEMILDAPFVLQDSDGSKWKPTNFSKKFYGLQLLRIGLEKSLNLMTVRLGQKIGMEKILNTLKVFNIMDNAKPYLSYTLGAGETTLMQMLSGYSMIINGGKRITTSLIDRIQDRYGKTLYRHTPKLCTQCSELTNTMPQLPDTREQVVNPVIAYQITSMLQGVVQRGSGKNLRDLNMSLAGKTGTTNDNRDAWFIGGTPDLVVGAYIGFDVPRELGNYKKWNIWFQETGGSAALPMVKEFLRQAKPSIDKIPFRAPKGVRFVRLDKETGRRATAKTKYSQLEAFIPGTEPKIMTKQEQESSILQQNNNGLEFGTIY